jgi:para-aminobenzoate synthetase/4-amino-4-deoxychorismate lyase
MIVDMIRNDMGRVADPGSVKVPELYAVEQYPTVLQMTSTVTGETSASWSDIVAALFPCASITGAPKIRTMEIIAALEAHPRGLYTGAIGFVAPNRRSRFSVAIRTVQLDLEGGVARYDVGGGIVWDSDAGEEYDECRAKAAVLSASDPEFALLETMRYEPGLGILFVERHLSRLSASATWFGFRLNLDEVRMTLRGFSSFETSRIRLLVDRLGGFTVEQTPMRSANDRPVRLTLARRPIDPSNPFLHHKTTNRLIYDAMREGIEGDFDDVVLHTPDGLATETCLANLAVMVEGRLVTPAIGTGLLPGVCRADCLARGLVEEATVTTADLQSAGELFVMSALRGIRRAILT